jgi:hypothetical protein
MAVPEIEIPEPLGLYAKRLSDRGKEFLSAFELLTANDSEQHTYVAYFLLAHSLELLLKSFLAARGTTKKELKKNYGHRLRKIYSACEKHAIPVVAKLELLVKHLAVMNGDDDLRYPSAYNLALPDARECQDVMNALSEAIAPVINRENLKAGLRLRSQYHGIKVKWSD